MNIRKLTITAFLIAINVVLSSLIVIPLGPIKAAPVQHFVNVLCAVFVGPWYGLAQAFISSVLRISFGTGSAFAFPGSMIGVLLSSLFYMYRKHIFMASVGLQDFFIKPLMLMFIVSSFIGALISYILLIILKRRGLLDRFNKN